MPSVDWWSNAIFGLGEIIPRLWQRCSKVTTIWRTLLLCDISCLVSTLMLTTPLYYSFNNIVRTNNYNLNYSPDYILYLHSSNHPLRWELISVQVIMFSFVGCFTTNVILFFVILILSVWAHGIMFSRHWSKKKQLWCVFCKTKFVTLLIRVFLYSKLKRNGKQRNKKPN